MQKYTSSFKYFTSRQQNAKKLYKSTKECLSKTSIKAGQNLAVVFLITELKALIRYNIKIIKLSI